MPPIKLLRCKAPTDRLTATHASRRIVEMIRSRSAATT
jgi:hypothetical protein